jgi:hypothetical protein
MHKQTRFGMLWVCVAVLFAAGTAHAATITVAAGGNLQAAIDAAKPGDTILLAAGATFTGNFTLPAKGGSAYITIRSSASDSSLPATGTRIDPSYASLLPKVRSDQYGPAFRTVGAATYWRLQFLEIFPSLSTASANLVEFGAANSTQTSLSEVPQHLMIDRCYLHGNASWGQRRGVALNSGDAQVINSYISDIKGINEDTQAIAGWNGPGPFLIENDYLEASGENIIFGGDAPNIPNLVPSNITIRHNLISKPLAWMTTSWTVKNLVEFKNAQDVLVDGNIIEHNWAAGQQGYSILFTPRGESGLAPWSVVQNITIQNNIIRHVAAVFNVLGYDTAGPTQQTNNIVIKNNLIYDVSTAYAEPGHHANGWLMIISGGSRDITFDHNTVDNNGDDTISFYPLTSPAITTASGVVITNNLLRDNAYGIFGDGSSPGNAALAEYAPDAIVARNTIGGASSSRYPANNLYPTVAQWLADFIGAASGDYQLLSGSESKGAATDGTDTGVNFTTLNSAQSGTSSSDGGGSASSTPYTGTRIALPGRLEAENYDKGGEGVAYRDTTSGNSGGAYRSDDVDIRATTDASGSYNLKSVRAGEWLNYSVNVATAGTYALQIRAASSGPGGTVHVAVDGKDVTGSIALANTGGWNTWQTVTKNGVTLPAGAHIVTLAIDANGSGGTVADINWLAFTASASSGSTPYTGTPIALPGRIEAENYDKGGEGLAYRDTTSGNSGGVYRSDDVDIRTTTDASGNYNLKSVRAGEWVNYSVNVGAAGTYALQIRMASSGTGGTVHVAVDGTDVTGSIALPNTGDWNTWQTVTKSAVSLPAGAHIVTLAIDANGSSGTAADINWLAFSSSAGGGSTPYTGTPIALPGRIEAENYDKGGEGTAYRDTTAGNSGGAYRSDDVDLAAASDTGGGYKVKTAVAGEWLDYTVKVTSAGTYSLDARVCSSGAGGTFHIEIDGVNVTGEMTVPNTGSWNSFTTITKAGVPLSAGTHVFRVVLDTDGASGLTGNFNWFAVR